MRSFCFIRFFLTLRWSLKISFDLSIRIQLHLKFTLMILNKVYRRSFYLLIFFQTLIRDLDFQISIYAMKIVLQRHFYSWSKIQKPFMRQCLPRTGSKCRFNLNKLANKVSSFFTILAKTLLVILRKNEIFVLKVCNV